jgi:hypothetical protein
MEEAASKAAAMKRQMDVQEEGGRGEGWQEERRARAGREEEIAYMALRIYLSTVLAHGTRAYHVGRGFAGRIWIRPRTQAAFVLRPVQPRGTQ